MERCTIAVEEGLLSRARLKVNTRKQLTKSMSLLIESIKLLDGKFYNLDYHEQRMIRSLRSLHGASPSLPLEKFVKDSAFPETGLYKCRVVYDASSMEKTFTPYVTRPLRRGKAVTDDGISY